MARPSKLDDLVEKRICDALRAGHSYANAAKCAGLDESTIHLWRARGREEGSGRYFEFFKRVDAADHAAEDNAVAVLVAAFHSDDQRLAVQTAQWWLERRRGESWGKKEHVAETPLTEDEAERIVTEAAKLVKAG